MQTDVPPSPVKGLPGPPGRPAWLTETHRCVIDALLALILAAATLSFAYQYHPPGWPPFDRTAAALCLVVNLPLAVRRLAPVGVLLVSCAALLAYTVGGYQPSANIWAPLFAVFTLAARRPTRTSVAGACFAAPVWLCSAMATKVVSPDVALAQVVLGVGTAWAFGLTLRILGERNLQLAALTLRLQHEQAARMRHALTEERLRIARELHDVIAHHISVVAVQAGLAGYVFESDPTTARSALDTIAGSSREALEEMRGLLHVLRVPPEEPEGGSGRPEEPAPGLARLPALIERVEAAGLTVELTVAGEPYPLAPGPDLSAYRVVQEALTNVLKHAGPADVRLSLDYRPGRLSVGVRDGGPTARGGAPVPPGVSGGHGLIGMRERVEAHGGMLRAGSLPDGGFEVVFTLPGPGAGSAGGGPDRG
ncbi:sensor histidine kinase [Kitasatospora sp. NPDC059747]|uniref:sensor histidine kinase n=1 Tax=Kitasatospora sp. NPDC059747 TaxID=3346930 RepID=UPI0036537B2C